MMRPFYLPKTTTVAPMPSRGSQSPADMIEILRVEAIDQAVQARRAGRVADEFLWRVAARNVGRCFR